MEIAMKLQALTSMCLISNLKRSSQVIYTQQVELLLIMVWIIDKFDKSFDINIGFKTHPWGNPPLAQAVLILPPVDILARTAKDVICSCSNREREREKRGKLRPWNHFSSMNFESLKIFEVAPDEMPPTCSTRHVCTTNQICRAYRLGAWIVAAVSKAVWRWIYHLWLWSILPTAWIFGP